MLDFQPSPAATRFAFNKHDVVRISGVSYEPVETNENGYVFVRSDGQGVANSFTHSEMARLVALGRVEHDRGALLPESARARIAAPSSVLSTLPAKDHRRAKSREAMVLAFLELEKNGEVKRTDVSIKDALQRIQFEAGRFLSIPSTWDDGPLEAGTMIVPKKVSARSLRRWVKAYEEFGIAGLYDAVSNRGNRERRLKVDELALMTQVVNRYISVQKPSLCTIYDDVKRIFEEENKKRRAEHEPELVRPSRETVRRTIKSLDPFHCDVAREGVERARRKHAPVGMGLDLTRPLQRVEMDTWKVDLVSLMAESGLGQCLSDEDRASLGLDGKKSRWHLTVAMCATTRCILAMRLSRTPNAGSTIQTMDMMLHDKGVWSDAVGALSPWNMAGVPEEIVTDCGSEYVSQDVRVSARDLGIRVEHAPAGLPEMRGRIERFFRTLSVNLTPRLTGRTFGNMIEKGGYDPETRAALTADDLCNALIRWVVDIYHRTPHAGLGGESPKNCWDRLTDKFGVCPAPDLRRRRLAFGAHRQYSVLKTGITILGVRYHSEALAHWALHAKDRQVQVRWYSEDIGAIAVELDGEWVDVPAVFDRYNGVRAQTWLAAVRELRAASKRQAEFDENTVFDAIRHIEQINGEAMRRRGLLVEDWSKERISDLEERLFIGFNCQASAKDAPAEPTDTRWGEMVQTSAAALSNDTEKNVPAAEDSFSALPTSNACPASEQGASHREGPADDPEWELEDK